ncbi:MAG: ribokinase [Paracoccaceae bacterium]|nr:ribokinase [Paracoccaceae bacterium]
MAIFNLGSINTDHFYRLDHLPAPGETLAALGYGRGLGGKGANQSVAAARAGADVRHIGAIGADGLWMRDRLATLGVDCNHIAEVEAASGHAIIMVDACGENAIVLYPGANQDIPDDMVAATLAEAGPNDWLMLQNETSSQVRTARLAQEQGLFVVYSAAPFEAGAAQAVMPYLSLLIVNEVEASQLCSALGVTLADLPVPHVLVTLGARGAVWHDLGAGVDYRVRAIPVMPVDTTAAGDTFAGYLVAGLAEGMSPVQAMRLARAAAALKVTRAGTADAIPARAEVDAFLAAQPSE